MSIDDDATSPNVETLRSYEAGAARWAAQSRNEIGPAKLAFLDRIRAAVPPPAHVLELGSGTGRDALRFEQLGYTVRRTDAARSFIDLMAEQGWAAEQVNVLTDAIPTGADLVYASAVFLHFTADELRLTLDKIRMAVRPEACLAFTVKAGDGQAWSTAKVGRRFFRYWSPQEIAAVVAERGWAVTDLAETDGLSDRWLEVIARRPA